MNRTRSFTNGMACTASAPALPTTCQLPLVLTLPASNAREHFMYVSFTVEELSYIWYRVPDATLHIYS